MLSFLVNFNSGISDGDVYVMSYLSPKNNCSDLVNHMSVSSQWMSVSLVLTDIVMSSPLLMSAFLPVCFFLCFFPSCHVF